MDEKFLNAAVIQELLTDEGGYVNDPDDPGGETKGGISKRSYPHLDIKNLTNQEIIEIYYRDWWMKYHYDRIENVELAGEVLEFSVNAGPKQAHMTLQRAVQQSGGGFLDVDGVLGDLSFAAVNLHPNQAWLTDKFRLLAITYYWKLNKPKFMMSWVHRALF